MERFIIDWVFTVIFVVTLFRFFVSYVMCWLLKKYTNAEVQMALPGFLCLRGIIIAHPQYTLNIKNVSLAFRLFNDGNGIIFYFRVEEVNVTKKEGEDMPDSGNVLQLNAQKQFNIAPQLATLTKWIGVELHHLNVWFNLKKHLVHLSTAKGELNFDQHDANQIVQATAYLQKTAVAIWAVAENTQILTGDETSTKPTLKVSYDARIEAGASFAEEGLSLQRLSVVVNDFEGEIMDKLSGLLSGKVNQETETDLQPVAKQSLEDAIYNFSPFIPKDFRLRINGIELSGMKGSLSPYTVSALSCAIDSTFKLSNTLDISGPLVSIDFRIDKLEAEVNLLEAMKIEKCSVNGKLENKELTSNIELRRVAVDYHHEEWMKWLKLNFTKPLSLQGNKTISPQAKITHLDDQNAGILSRAEVSFCMSQYTAKYYPSPQHSSEAISVGLENTKMKFQGARMDELSLCEMFMSNLWCHLGKIPTDPFLQWKKEYHQWGSPLYISLLSVQQANKALFPEPVEVLLTSVQVEWTPDLPPVALKALGCIVDFQKAISDLGSQKEVKVNPGIQKPSSRGSRTLDVTIYDFNVYLLGGLVGKKLRGKDLCYMVRFDTTTYHTSPKKISFSVEGFKAITILDERVGQHVCANSKKLKGYWLYVKKFHGLSYPPFGGMTVALQEKVELFWNQELHSRFGAITSGIKEFCNSFLKISHPSKSNSKKSEECTTSITINAECQVKVVVDLYQSSTQLHVYFRNATFLSSDEYKTIKAHVSQVDVLKGGLLGLNTAAFIAVYNQLKNGYIHHPQSNTFIYLYLDPKLEEGMKTLLLCEFIFLVICLM